MYAHFKNFNGIHFGANVNVAGTRHADCRLARKVFFFGFDLLANTVGTLLAVLECLSSLVQC